MPIQIFKIPNIVSSNWLFKSSPGDLQSDHYEGEREVPTSPGGPGDPAATGFTSPGTMANDAAVGDSAWTNPDNAKLSDDSYADVTDTVAPLWFSNWLKATNFGFTVPIGATITGVEVKIEHHAEDPALGDHDIRLMDETGTIVGEDKESNVVWDVGNDEIFTYGSSTDLWELTLTLAIVNHANFGLAMTAEQFAGAGEVTMKVDNIQLNVHYTT